METEAFRRQLLFRSWHRGTREMDLLLGRFADRTLPTLDASGLEVYALFLQETDPDLYDFYCARLEKESFPSELHELLERFRAFSPA